MDGDRNLDLAVAAYFIDVASVLINLSTLGLGDELAVDFGINYLWYYNGISWASIEGLNPEDMIDVDLN